MESALLGALGSASIERSVDQAEMRDSDKLLGLIGIDEAELAILTPGRQLGADEYAEAKAVRVGRLLEIQNHALALRKHRAHG